MKGPIMTRIVRYHAVGTLRHFDGTLGTSVLAQSQDLTFSSVDVLKTPKDVYVGEVAGVGANSKGEIFVYTRTGHPYATLGDNRTFSHGGSRLFLFDRKRQLRPRVGPGRLRLQRGDRPARRSAGQRLDDRRRRQSGREVQHRRQHRARARPQA